MILGNLYRGKGQVGKATRFIKRSSNAQRLSRIEHAYVPLCLGLDYKRGVRRFAAHEAFEEVLRLEPKTSTRS